MKMRVGIGIGAWPFPQQGPSAFFDFIERCDAIGVDSLWFSDRILGPSTILEPVVTIATLAARSKTMKFGTSALLLPLRNPVVLAKELATLDFLSNGRLLLVVGLGSEDPREYEACGVPKAERGKRTNEAILALRKLWQEPEATFEGRYYQFHQATIEPKPVQKPGPPIWIGGRSEAALRRAGQLGDGWLASAITPEESAQGIAAIRRYATEAGRQVPEDHYGGYLSCAIADSREEALRQMPSPGIRRQDNVAPEAYNACGTAKDILGRLNEYKDAGVTKFVLRPVCPPEQWVSQVERLAQEVIAPFQTPFTAEELGERTGTTPA